VKMCPSCGAVTETEWELCPECGVPVQDMSFLHHEESFKKKCEQDPLNPDPLIELADFLYRAQNATVGRGRVPCRS